MALPSHLVYLVSELYYFANMVYVYAFLAKLAFCPTRSKYLNLGSRFSVLDKKVEYIITHSE